MRATNGPRRPTCIEDTEFSGGVPIKLDPIFFLIRIRFRYASAHITSPSAVRIVLEWGGLPRSIDLAARAPLRREPPLLSRFEKQAAATSCCNPNKSKS